MRSATEPQHDHEREQGGDGGEQHGGPGIVEVDRPPETVATGDEEGVVGPVDGEEAASPLPVIVAVDESGAFPDGVPVAVGAGQARGHA